MFSRENITLMTATAIRHRLLDLGITGADLARAAGVSRQMISFVLTGHVRTPWLRRLVAEKLGMTYQGMWGEPDPGTERGQRPRRSVSPSFDTSNESPAGPA